MLQCSPVCLELSMLVERWDPPFLPAQNRAKVCRMFVDARSVPPGTVFETEVCIVGAGAAGITLAREFINSGFRVALLCRCGGTRFRGR